MQELSASTHSTVELHLHISLNLTTEKRESSDAMENRHADNIATQLKTLD